MVKILLTVCFCTLSALAGQQVINPGLGPNVGVADNGFDAFRKVNLNFSELYSIASETNLVRLRANDGSRLQNLNAPVVYNVKNFGAVADVRRITDGVIVNGSTAFSSATANFTSSDVGKSILISEGRGWTNNLLTTITAVLSSNSVTMSDSATFSSGGNICTIGTDNTLAFQAALDAANSAGGAVYVPSGWYISRGLTVASNVTFAGSQWVASRITSADPGVLLNISSSCVIRDLWLDGPYWNANMSGLTNIAIRPFVGTATNAIGVHHWCIDNVTIERFAVGIECEYTWSARVDNPYIHICGTGVRLKSQANEIAFQNGEILACNIGVLTTNSTFAGVTGSASLCLFRDMTIENNNGPAVLIEGSTEGLGLTGIWFESNGLTNYWSNNIYAPVHILSTGNYAGNFGAHVIGCRFNSTGGTVKNTYCVLLSGGSFATVDRNVFSDWTGAGVNVSGTGNYVGKNVNYRGFYEGVSQSLSTDNGTNGFVMLQPWGFRVGGVINARSAVYTSASGAQVPALGMFDKYFSPAQQQTVTGSLGGNVTLSNLVKALESYGLIKNQTTP